MKSPLYGVPKELYIRRYRCFKNAIEYYGSACMLSPFSPSSKYDQALSLLSQNLILFGGRWEQEESLEPQVVTVYHKA